MFVQIDNVRLGDATNSSSSHWMALFTKGSTKVDGSKVEYLDGCDYEFGWDDFVLDTLDQKMAYLALQVSYSLKRFLDDEYVAIVIKDLFGFTQLSSSYVDGQSVFHLPLSYNRKGLHLGFVRQLESLFRQENFVVLGGNDNDAEDFAEDFAQNNGTANFRLSWLYIENGAIARYDKLYKYWSIFNPYTGTKLRLSFGNNTHTINASPTKAFAPELVDLHITDYCPFGCEFCYMASTLQGKHAQFGDIYKILQTLAENEVFEVAIGGGEPTLHPQFAEILEVGKKMGINMNFTTKNLAWLRNDEQYRAIESGMRAFAYTPAKVEDLDTLRNLVSMRALDKNRVNIHLVMGAVSRDEFRAYIQACYESWFRITLLGYKTTGEGEAYQNSDQFMAYDWFLNDLVQMNKENGVYRISMDTVLASDYEGELLKHFSPNTFHTSDGQFSAFVDAVNLTMSPASYLRHEIFEPLTATKTAYNHEKFISYDGEKFLENFAKW